MKPRRRPAGKGFTAWAVIYLLANLFIHLPNNTNPESRLALLCSLAEDHTFAINNYQHWTVDWARTTNGNYYSNKAPGPALLGYPLFLLADTVLTADVPTRIQRDRVRWEYSWLTLKILAIQLQIVPFLVIVTKCLRRLEGLGASLAARCLAGVAMLFGNTAALLMNTYFGHGMAAAAILLLSLALLARRGVLAGLAFGLAVLADYGSAVLLPGLLLAVAVAEPRDRCWRFLARLLVGGVLPGVLWWVYHSLAFGGPFALPVACENPEFVDHDRYRLLGLFAPLPDLQVMGELLFGPRRGYLCTQPWVFVAVGAALWAVRRTATHPGPLEVDTRRLAAFVLPGCGLLFWMNASFGGWHGGFCPGPRYVSSILPTLGLLLGFTYDTLPKWLRTLAVGLVAIAVGLWAVVFSTTLYGPPESSLWPFLLAGVVKTGSGGSMLKLAGLTGALLVAILLSRHALQRNRRGAY